MTTEPQVRISKVCTDKKHGTWYAIGAKRGWVVVRITNGGRVTVDSVCNGKHPVFTPQEFCP